MTLDEALQALTSAHGSSELARAFGRLQSAVKQARAGSKTKYGALTQTFVAAMAIWDAQKAEGVSRAERLAGLEKTLRAAWPQTRAWKYVCDTCDDYGLEMAQCPGDRTCGREKEHLPHEFGRPCWCGAGNRFRPPAKASPDDFAAAGKTPKPKGFTRFGR